MSFFGLGDELLWWCPSLDDSGNGTTTLNDLSGNGRNGTLTNMVTSGAGNDWVADTGSGGVRALDFDGANDFVVDSTLGISGNAEVAISFWLYWRSGSTGVLGFGETAQTIRAFGAFVDLWRSGGISIETAGGQSAYNSAAAVTQNNWAHVVIQKTAGALRTTSQIAINGTIYNTNVGSLSTPNFANLNFHIGRWANLASFYFNGRLDDIRVFNNVLTQAEITKLASRRGYQEAGPISIFAAAHNAVRGAV